MFSSLAVRGIIFLETQPTSKKSSSCGWVRPCKSFSCESEAPQQCSNCGATNGSLKQSRRMDSTRNNFCSGLGAIITNIRSKMATPTPTPTRGENDGSYPPPTCPSCGKAYPCSCR
ncbi:hypothetical protein Fcan01_04035 [Folsomia candida]|uniref:Uncharacterized protein n=1 Tax=Folsomia candida TaxID=158441 RepID=A0A226EUA0_FOLCA|nr:hypothetical protein Fcan01_04035 [Folsomia candida]